MSGVVQTAERWRLLIQTAENEHQRLMKLREEYQSTCTQSVCYDAVGREEKKLNSQIDLAFSVQFNLANQVASLQTYSA